MHHLVHENLLMEARNEGDLEKSPEGIACPGVNNGLHID